MDLDLVKAVQAGGAVVVLTVIVIAFVRGWIVPGHLFDRALRERDEQLDRERQQTADWRAMALGSVDTGSRLLEIAQSRHPRVADVRPP